MPKHVCFHLFGKIPFGDRLGCPAGVGFHVLITGDLAIKIPFTSDHINHIMQFPMFG